MSYVQAMNVFTRTKDRLTIMLINDYHFKLHLVAGIIFYIYLYSIYTPLGKTPQKNKIKKIN